MGRGCPTQKGQDIRCYPIRQVSCHLSLWRSSTKRAQQWAVICHPFLLAILRQVQNSDHVIYGCPPSFLTRGPPKAGSGDWNFKRLDSEDEFLYLSYSCNGSTIQPLPHNSQNYNEIASMLDK